jgi:transketolase
VIGLDAFGASAPGPELARRLGLTEAHVAAAVRATLSR